MTIISTTESQASRGIAHPLLWSVVLAWALAIAGATATGVFQTNGAGVPVPLPLAAVLPPFIYLLAYRTFAGLRIWVAALDLSWIVGAQTFRVIGFVFLVLWGLGELPTVFALTAGLGDLAVGIFALTVLLAVERRKDGWTRKVRVLIAVGMLDFVAAIGTAILSGQGQPLRFPGEVAPTLMQVLPMAMIPAFAVPLFIILHIVAWQKLPGRH